MVKNIVNVIVVGGGGHSKSVISLLKKSIAYKPFGYIDNIDRGEILGIPYIGDDHLLSYIISEKHVAMAVIAIGDIPKRKTLFLKLKKMGYGLPAIISHNAVVQNDVTIGDGTIVMDGVIIQPGTSVGMGVILNTSVSVDHDCSVNDFVHIAPGSVLCGGVSVGQCSFIGAGSTVIQNITIARNCMIGAGAVVVKNCELSSTYLGFPAKVLSK